MRVWLFVPAMDAPRGYFLERFLLRLNQETLSGLCFNAFSDGELVPLHLKTLSTMGFST